VWRAMDREKIASLGGGGSPLLEKRQDHIKADPEEDVRKYTTHFPVLVKNRIPNRKKNTPKLIIIQKDRY